MPCFQLFYTLSLYPHALRKLKQVGLIDTGITLEISQGAAQQVLDQLPQSDSAGKKVKKNTDIAGTF